jgi:hypothetical protein
MWLRLFLVLTPMMFAACDDTEDTLGQTDGPAQNDARLDVGVDAEASDAGVDAEASDAGVDAEASDAGVDADASDAVVEPDSSPDAAINSDVPTENPCFPSSGSVEIADDPITARYDWAIDEDGVVTATAFAADGSEIGTLTIPTPEDSQLMTRRMRFEGPDGDPIEVAQTVKQLDETAGNTRFWLSFAQASDPTRTLRIVMQLEGQVDPSPTTAALRFEVTYDPDQPSPPMGFGFSDPTGSYYALQTFSPESIPDLGQDDVAAFLRATGYADLAAAIEPALEVQLAAQWRHHMGETLRDCFIEAYGEEVFDDAMEKEAPRLGHPNTDCTRVVLSCAPIREPAATAISLARGELPLPWPVSCAMDLCNCIYGCPECNDDDCNEACQPCGGTCFTGRGCICFSDDCSPCAEGSICNDPHLMSHDGLRFDFHGVGEFTSVGGIEPSDPFQLQVRFGRFRALAPDAPAACRDSASIIIGFAAQVGPTRVRLVLRDSALANGFYVNEMRLPDDWIHEGFAGGQLTRVRSGIQLDWETGESLFWKGGVDGHAGQIFDVTLPFTRKDTVWGLLGTYNDETGDDITLSELGPDGPLSLTQPVEWTDLNQRYGNSWRVTPETSLFLYGEGESTETFTDLNAPYSRVELEQEPAYPMAMEACAAIGLVQGAQRACAFDVLCGGEPYLEVWTGAPAGEALQVSDCAADFPGVCVSNCDPDLQTYRQPICELEVECPPDTFPARDCAQVLAGDCGQPPELGPIDQHTVLSAESCFNISNTLTVNASLYIEPGVTLYFRPSAEVQMLVQGVGFLIAEGTPESPILLTKMNDGQPDAHWGGLFFERTIPDRMIGVLSRSAHLLKHTVVEYGGGHDAPDSLGPGNLVVGYGGRFGRSDLALQLDHVTLRHSTGAGLVFDGTAERFKVKQSILTQNAFPARIHLDAMPSLNGTSTYSGNTEDRLYVFSSEANNATLRAMTWSSLDVPWHLRGRVYITEPVTISAGARFEMAADSHFSIFGMGTLSANGTAEAPIVFGADSPTPGHWRGLAFGATQGVHRLSHAVVEYAGGAPPSQQLPNPGSLILINTQIHLNQVTLSHSSSSAVVVGQGTELLSCSGVDFISNNPEFPDVFETQAALDVWSSACQ